MDTRVKDLHLPAIPETVPVNHLPVSARASPRSTSDSPAQATLPISPTSRLLKPTLSWQAKAGWIPEPPTSSGRKPTGTDVDAGSSHKQVLTIAVDARDQATAAASRLSPSPPSASWHSATDPQQPFGGATGKQQQHTKNGCGVFLLNIRRWHCRCTLPQGAGIVAAVCLCL